MARPNQVYYSPRATNTSKYHTSIELTLDMASNCQMENLHGIILKLLTHKIFSQMKVNFFLKKKEEKAGQFQMLNVR